jgi:hypothetical protein
LCFDGFAFDKHVVFCRCGGDCKSFRDFTE